MNASTPSQSEQSSKKRTRFLLNKQSKFGCLTCKQRRIKCDEERPACLRCQRSGRACAGYPPNPAQSLMHRSASGSSLSSSGSDSEGNTSMSFSTVPAAITTVPWSRPQQQHYVDLGCTVLASDPFHMYSQSNLSIFSVVLPQLSQMFPSVNAAAAAFGAAYDSTLLSIGNSLAHDNSTKQYGLALKMLQLELERPEPQYAPLLITSTLLAAAEAIQARQKGAFAHVLGTFGIFMNGQAENQLLPSSASSSSQKAREGLSNDLVEMLEHMCLSVDVLVATFTWGQAPNLPPQPFSEATSNRSNIDELRQELPKLVHASMHLVSEASKETFKEYADLTYELVLKQSQMIARLRKWLSSFTDLVESNEARSQTVDKARYRNLHLLKAQCLATVLAVSNLRAVSQISWDKFAPDFDELVRCADIVLDEEKYLISSQSPLLPFSPCPGIIQPLFFTARKYRNSIVRRRAISLLRLTGFEGPFSGDFEADLATRFVEIEEGRPFSNHLRDDQVMTPDQIPDWRRIYSCWRLSERYAFDERIVKFCRRRKSKFEGETSPASQSLQTKADQWEVWEEVILSFKRRSRVGHVERRPFQVDCPGMPLEGESKYVNLALQNNRLSRDPDWIKSAVGSGEYWNFYDHPDGTLAATERPKPRVKTHAVND